MKKKLQYIIPVGLIASGIAAWMYIIKKGDKSQIVSSSLFKGIMFNLRQNKDLKVKLGENLVQFDTPIGKVNNVQGRADINFKIKSLKTGNIADVEFKGEKVNGDLWKFDTFNLKLENEV
ncbi:hypothetical protein HDU92_005444, partial [Lobulomyces angularis]